MSVLDGDRGSCARCGRAMPADRLNLEAMIHHRARTAECLDRKECERAKRKAVRKNRL